MTYCYDYLLNDSDLKVENLINEYVNSTHANSTGPNETNRSNIDDIPFMFVSATIFNQFSLNTNSVMNLRMRSCHILQQLYIPTTFTHQFIFKFITTEDLQLVMEREVER